MMDTVETLIEAIPYIKKFSGKTFVIKIGGSMLNNRSARKSLLEDIALLKCVGIQIIIIHGGGKDISGLSEKLGVETKFVDGLRHTNDDTLGIVRMALGKLNGELVEELEGLGCKSIGTTAKSGKMVLAKRVEKLGNVGKMDSVNTKVIKDFLDDDYTPIIQPIGLDENGAAVNINADELAAGIAKAMGAQKLIFLTDVPGLLEDAKDEKTLISKITTKELKKKLKWDEIEGGMIPKVKGVIDAVNGGVKSVHMIDGRTSHAILLEILTDNGIGTMVTE